MEIEYGRSRRYKASGYPVRHKRKEHFYPRIKAPMGYSQRLKDIRRLDDELDRFILSSDDYLKFVNDAYASNIHWSTRLEGNPLSERSVRRITRSMLKDGISETDPGPKQEIVNHLIQWLNLGLFHLPWSHDLIRWLHHLLLHDTGPTSPIGTYRDDDAEVTTTDTKLAYFIPCPYRHIDEEMGWLLDWVNDNAQVFDPITAATVFFHEFESIHPFFDGNGRVGRTLFHQYLRCNGLYNSDLIIFEGHLFRDQETYYELLSYTDEKGDYTPLIDFVSQVIQKSYHDAVERFSKMDLLGSGLDEDSKRILIRAKREKDWFRLKDAGGWVDGRSEQTVRMKLSHMVDLGALEETGRTKGKRYRFKDPIRKAKEELARHLSQDLSDTPYREFIGRA